MFAPEALASISSSLKAGQYNLLLGAGISLDSINGVSKKKLPSTNDFRLDLCRLKGARESSTLQRVFSTLTPAEIKEHVESRFQGCAPGPSLKSLTNFLWRRIFTFNVDDALEAAYQLTGKHQSPQIFHFDDPYVESQNLSQIPIVHLHGWVGAPDKPYVFATSEYVRQIKSINPWMVVLTQFLPADPFIIIGASLDEVDLEFYLAHRSPITARPDKGPSILVEPFPDAVTERDCEKYGLMLFRGTAQEFWEYLEKEVPVRPTPNELVPVSIQNLFPAGTSKQIVVPFSADFEPVPIDPLKNETASRFHFGHAPSWEDLAGNMDIPREYTPKLVVEIESRFKGGEKIVVLSDETGTGKSTILRRVALEFARKPVKVLVCSALSRIDPARTAEALDLIDGPVLIVVDNFADQATVISDMMGYLEKKDLVVLGAERLYREHYIKRALSRVSGRLTQGLDLHFVEAERLLNLYLRLGMVGRPEATKNPNAFAKQVFGDPIAVAACRIMNDFRPLDRIIKSIIADSSELSRKRYVVAALAHFCFRGGVRHEVLTTASGYVGWKDQFESSHPMPLAYFDRTDRSFVVPLNSTVASRILDTVSKTEPDLMFDSFVSLAKAIAPRVNRNTIRRRSPEARLAGRLFDYDPVVRGFLGPLASTFYSDTREAWQWNSRYWEQVALMLLAHYQLSPSTEEGQDALRQAVQHARHAVSIENHPLSLTTLGRVLMAQLGQEGMSRTATYEDAFIRLTSAIEIERSWSPPSVHPFVVLFRGTRDYLASRGKLTNEQAERLRGFVSEAQRLFPRDADISDAIAAVAADIQ
jgi:hypothetical protein